MKKTNTLRLMFLGDLAGTPGVEMFEKWMPQLKKKYNIDAVVVNGENAAKNGRGISAEIATHLHELGASAITSGNHIWANKKIYSFIDENSFLLRPANYPSICPGKGYTIISIGGSSVAIVSLQGRVFMHENLDCPFRTIESLLSLLAHKTNIIFVDFHAEATSEKRAMASFLDGRVSGLLGTHTHIQTSDEQILPAGTAYITDLGFAGARNSSLGVENNIILNRFLSQMPVQFKIATEGPMLIEGVWVEVEIKTGKALNIERIRIID
jgi:metallophosphoesterase (TIGR00282 family)